MFRMALIRYSVCAALVAVAASATAPQHGIFAFPQAERVHLPAVWPLNSWATVPVFAFPGCSPRFMNASELAYFGKQGFSNLLIWGVNATCLAADGSTFSPDCSSSRCYCNESAPETQSWVLNMESSLQSQAAALKAAAAPAVLPVLGYIEGLSAQQYYASQAEFMTNASYASLLLSIDAIGVIDCFKEHCNWQGVEYRQYDLRQAAAREYYVNNVIGSLIAAPDLDGTFIDVIDWWNAVCASTWTCSAAEKAELFNASLIATTEMLTYAAAHDKVLSISAHSTSEDAPEYYNAHVAILQQFPGHAIRFYEFFTAGDVFDVIHEAQVLGLALHVHSATYTLAPDWVELAAFLLAANDQSTFSYSQGAWMFDSFPWMTEFTHPLGAPLNGPTMNTTSYQPWTLVPGVNLIASLPPTVNASVPGMLDFLGDMDSAEECASAAHSPSAAHNYTAFTWVGPTRSNWGRGCYARYDDFNVTACVLQYSSVAPCYTMAEGDCISSAAMPIIVTGSTISRDFEHLHVELDTSTMNATLTWK